MHPVKFQTLLNRNFTLSSRRYASQMLASSRLNRPINFEETSILHQSRGSARKAFDLQDDGDLVWQNLHSAINRSMAQALKNDPKVLVFGEDVAFGGVFRCSKGLVEEFGSERVFNTPLCEQGIVGFAIGCAAEGLKPIAEIQFADYIYPAFDQLVNEAAKFRYRGSGAHCGGLVVRMPCGTVGHGALYHSQSPESLFSHIPGLRVVMPRSPTQAKGLLTSAVLDCNDPVLFLEPKILYRTAEEYVPADPHFRLPLDSADVLKSGENLTVISYGQPLYLCEAAIKALERDKSGISIELIDLRAIYPWDRDTIIESVKKTGRAVVVHESMYNAGVGAEIAATIQRSAFTRLEAPVARVTGRTAHAGLIFEKFNVPDVARIYDAMKDTIEF